MSVRVTGRPQMPDGYGVVDAGPVLSWETVERRLVDAVNYWLSTARPDGRPHVVPRWGVWIEDKFFYDGSPATRHSQNLEMNPHCALHLENGTEVTIVEGVSTVPPPVVGDFGVKLADEYRRKYAALGYAPEPTAWSDDSAGGLHVLSPTSAIAWSVFPKDLTRYEFD